MVSYWEKRETEDKNMGRFLAATERDLLGPWVGLLMGDVAGDDQTASSVSEGGFDWADLTTRAIEILPEVSQALDSSLLAILMQVFYKRTFSTRILAVCNLLDRLKPSYTLKLRQIHFSPF